ncbi:MAG: Ig-like domain-containing protein [Ruminococcus sp.]|jgi:hypothetical protein|nr:Ig-like domain-containing protein [Ruminococcus sp.]
MKHLFKKILSLTLSISIMLMAVPFTSFAAEYTETLNINDYSITTVDQLEAPINNAIGRASVSGGTVTVTGEFNYDQDTFDAPTILLRPGVTVKWQAELNGTYIRIDSRSTGGTFELADGGGIYNNSFGIYNVSKAVNIKVSGGIIHCENDNLSTEPAIETNGNIEITGGEIIAYNFYAIRMETTGNDGTRARETLTVSGDAKIKAYGAHDAIYVSDYKTVNINGGTITGDADNDGVAVYRDAISANDHNTININGGTLNGQIYLNENNELNINGGTISNHGVAVYLFDGGNVINIRNDATVTSSNSGTLFTNAYGTGNTNIVNISGGTVTNTGDGFFAIDGDFKEINISGGEVYAPWGAIYTEGDVTVSGGTVKASTNSRPAIWGAAGKNVSVTGGLVYASKSNNIVSYATLAVTGNGMVVGFNPSTDRGSYANGYSTDIYWLPKTDGVRAVWATVGEGAEETTGISYTNGANTGFIPITGQNVITSSDTVIINGKTSAEIASAVATAFNTFDLVMVTGTNTALAEGITLSIPNEKTLNWSASTEAASEFDADLLTLSGSGTFNMNGGYIKNADGDGIAAIGTVKINIKGGEISVADDIGINNAGTGLIEVTNAAIEATVEGGKAIYSAGQINIKSGSTIEVPYGTALQSASRIFIYNIDVFCKADAATGSGGFANATGGVTCASGAVIVAWNSKAGTPPPITSYDQYSTENLDFAHTNSYSGSVRWDIKDRVSGIQFTDKYSAGDSVFFPVSGVNVTALQDTIDISGLNVTDANAEIAAAITALGNAGNKSLLTVIGSPLTINDSIVINLNEKVTSVNWYVDLTAAAGMTKPLIKISGGYAIYNLGRLIAADGYAIQGSNITRITNNGLIFGYSDAANNVIDRQPNSDGIGSPSLLISWDKSQDTTYGVGTDYDIKKSSMSVTALDSINVLWAYENGQSGIKYSYSDGTRQQVNNGASGFIYFYHNGSGFIPVPGVTVVRNAINKNTHLEFDIPDDHIYNGSAQGIGEVTFDELTEAQAGTITVKYNGSTTVPTNAGTYTVMAEISGGSEYADTTIELGNYTIARKALTITGATVAAKAQDDTSSANVTRVTLDGDIDELIPSTDYTMAGSYGNDYLAGTGKTVTVSITLLITAKANNYRVANEYSLTGQTINDPPTEVTFYDLEANGTSGTADTTVLTLTFDSDITGLEASDITVTGATRGMLARTDTGVYTLEISDITGTDDSIFEQGDTVSVTVEKDGFIINDGTQSVTVNKDNRPDVTFTAEQTGGVVGTTDSTGIVITFSQSVTGLTANDITITTGTGTATKGTLSGSGTRYTIGLTSVTAAENVTVEVADFGAYDITTTGLTVAVYKDLTNAQTPSITLPPQNATYPIGGTPTALSVSASVSDGGDLTYQWYSTATGETEDGSEIAGQTYATYTPPTNTVGTVYYYCVITNTNAAVDGETIATATSSVAAVIVLADATASASSSTYTQTVSGAIYVTVTPNGHTFTGITGLTEGLDYTVSPINSNVYTINTSYLDSLMTESVTLTFDADIGVDPHVSITITEAPTPFVPVTGIGAVSYIEYIYHSYPIYGSVIPDNATNQTISWSFDDGGTEATFTGNQFDAGSVPGTATLTATIANGLGGGNPYIEIFTIIIIDPDLSDYPPEPAIAESVTISGSSEVTVGEQITLSADVQPSDAVNRNVSWSSDDTNVAVVSSSGVVTGRNPGNVTITATAVTGVTGTIEITVNAPYVEPTTIYNVIVDGGTASPSSAAYGTVITVTATVPRGQEFVSWTVSGISALGGSPASFTMPAEDVTITANFRSASDPSSPVTPAAPSTPSVPYFPTTPPPAPPTPPAPATPPAADNPYVNPQIDIQETDTGVEVIAPNGVTSTVEETPEGVKVEAGVNESGAVNAQATAAAVSEAAKIAKESGESAITIQIPENAQGLSKNTIQQLVEAAGGLEITLELTSVADGKVVGGVTLPLTSATGQILTGLAFETKRTAQTESYVAENFNAKVLGSFETAQKGGWGVNAATISVGLDKLGFTAENGTKLQALIFDTKAKKWYKADAEIIDGNVVIITKRSGIVTIVTEPV